MQRQLPEWLIGLLIAIVVVVIVLLAANQLGIGDDPAITDSSGGWEFEGEDTARPDAGRRYGDIPTV